MKKLFFYALVLLCWGCQHPDAATATIVTSVLDKVGSALLKQYEAEGQKAVMMATSRDEAEALVQAVDLRWAPVWQAWDALALEHDTYATAIENGIHVDPYMVYRSWCHLHMLLTELGSVPHVLKMVNYECSE